MKKSLENIFASVSANTIVLAVGIAQSFILPKVLDPVQYGYWSYYMLCLGYSYIVMFGMCDGFYLKYGGIGYDQLDKKKYASLYALLVGYLAVLLVIGMVLINLVPVDDPEMRSVLIFVGISGALSCLISFFTLINQMTARFKVYARTYVIWKNTILAATILCLFFFRNNYKLVIIGSVIGQVLTLVLLLYYSWDIVRQKPSFSRELFVECGDNIRVGIRLTITNLLIGLFSGLGKYFVEWRMGIEQLAYYSFVFTISALFTQLLQAVALILFPALRGSTREKNVQVLKALDNILVYLSVVILILYYPARIVFSHLYVNYAAAMDCMVFLMPYIGVQCRIMLVYSTIYKVDRLETKMLKYAVYTIGACLALTFSFILLFNSKESVAFVVYVTFLIFLLLLKYNKSIRTLWKFNFDDIILQILFMLTNVLLGFSWYTFGINTALLLAYLVVRRRSIVANIKQLKKNFV